MVFRVERVCLEYFEDEFNFDRAVAFALGVVFLEHPTFSEDVKGIIFGTTVMVVVMTILILGGLTPYMLKWLKITDNDESLKDKPDHSLEKGSKETEKYSMIEDPTGEKENMILASNIFKWIFAMDIKYENE